MEQYKTFSCGHVLQEKVMFSAKNYRKIHFSDNKICIFQILLYLIGTDNKLFVTRPYRLEA